jgi:hypothetical protein
MAGRVQLTAPEACGEVALRIPGAVGDVTQPLPDDPGDVVDDALLRRQEGVDAVLRDQVPEALLGGPQRGHARPHVQRVELRRAAVTQLDPLDVVPDLVVLDQLDGREQRRLVEPVASTGHEAARHRAADVVVVHDQAGPGHDLALVKDRHREHAVVVVQRAPPRVVAVEHVTGPELLARPVGDQAPDEVVERGAVLHDVHAGDQAAAVRRHQGGVEVVAVIDDRRAGQPRGHPGLVVVDRPQPVPDDLEGDRVDRPAAAGSGSAARLSLTGGLGLLGGHRVSPAEAIAVPAPGCSCGTLVRRRLR